MTFAKIWEYKVKLQKSDLLTKIPKATGNLHEFQFKISQYEFRYLGIWITHNFKIFIKLFLTWKKFSIVGTGCHWQVEESVLLSCMFWGFIYFSLYSNFSSLFLTIDKLISRFILNKRNLCICQDKLQRHRQHTKERKVPSHILTMD